MYGNGQALAEEIIVNVQQKNILQMTLIINLAPQFGGAGLNKEKVVMNVETFKSLCLLG